ncbi:hypothetical protein H2248_001916 [Termitomyces sp. 'cryptogamus']|nr:hypothetical protein H2248_001916 [Termitomyces sp. 'cryptogamus']
MSGMGTACLTVTANPDVSGIVSCRHFGLSDQRVTPTELDELEKQSTTILITAFAILISTVIQAHTDGISDYHASIVLDLSWMNNTNLFIYFLLYVYHRVNLTEDELLEEVRVSTRGHATPQHRARWIYETKKALANFVTIIGSLHLTLMAAVGIWLWSHPAGFGSPELCSLSATVSMFGKQVQLGSSAFRKWSILVYSIVLIPILNLLIPLTFFSLPLLVLKYIFKSSSNIGMHTIFTGLGTLAIIDIVLLADMEVAIKNNTKQFQLDSKTQ